MLNKLREVTAKVLGRVARAKWAVAGLVIVAVIAVATCSQARATETARVAGDIGAQSAGGGSVAPLAASSGSTSTISAGGGSVSSRALGLGMPSFANGALTCEAQVPLIGGTYERENCGALLAARAAYELVHAGAGRDDVVKEALCQNSYLRRAYALTGRRCKEPTQ